MSGSRYPKPPALPEVTDYYISNGTEILSYVDIQETSFAGQQNRPNGLCIFVQNLSEFPLTVDEVGFLDKRSQNRFHLKDYFLGKGGQLPCKIESRSSITIYTTTAFNTANIHHRFKAAYVSTECGKRFTGSCNRLKLDRLILQ